MSAVSTIARPRALLDQNSSHTLGHNKTLVCHGLAHSAGGTASYVISLSSELFLNTILGLIPVST